MTMLPTTTTPALPSPTLDQKLTQVLKAAPELSKSPGLTVDLASASSDPTGNAQAVARGTQVISDTNSQQAVAQSTESHPSAITDALNWFSTKVVAPVAHDASVGIKDTLQAASPVLNVMNKPMQFAQHEYRYLHDVEARHGMLAALGEGLGIAAGAVLGTLGGGFYGGVLGAEAATALEGQLFYKDSWQRTTDGNTYVDPNTHNPVSFGRDVVTELSHFIPQLKQGSLDFKLTSGLIDGIADMQVGGTELLGVAGEVSGASAAGAAGKLGDYFGGTGVATAEDVQRAYDQYGSVRRAFQDIADKSAGEIALTPAYRPFAQQQNLLQALGRADTPEAVGQVFKNAVRANEMVFSGQVPSLAITRVPFQALHEAMGNSDIGLVQKMYKNTARIPDAWDEVSRGYSMKEFDPTSIDDGTTGIARMALFTENRQTAAAIADKYANADLPGKIQIYRNLQLSTLMNMAGFRGQSQEEYLSLFADPLMQRKVGRALDEALAGGMFGREAIYGLNDEGKNLSIVHDAESGWEYGAGILKNQTGKLQFLDLRTARHASQTLAKWAAYANGTTLEKAGASIHSMVGSIDDFAFDWATQGVFKPLVLLTPAYAMHIALAELIPNSLRLGFANMVRSGIQLNVAKIGARVEVKAAESAAADRLWAAAQDLEAKGGDIEAVDKLRQASLKHEANGEVSAILGLAYRLTGGDIKDATLASRYIEYLGGQFVDPAINSGHNYSEEILSREEKSLSLMRRAAFDAPMKKGSTFAKFGVESKQHLPAWQAALKEYANDPAGQMAAHLMSQDLRAGKSLDEATQNATQTVAHYLRNLPEDQRGRMLRESSTMTPKVSMFPDGPKQGVDNFDEWAATIVQGLRGVTRGGVDRVVNTDLLDHISKGEGVALDKLDAIPEESRPSLVKGRELLPAGTSTIQRIADVGFRKVLNPMVNFMSRQPIAFTEFKKQYAMLEKAVDSGVMNEDEAWVTAMNRTAYNVTRNVHNLTDRTQWTTTFRNWAPFYFAQEQAYRRMGRLLAEDPAAFRKYQLMISNMHNVGQVFTGPNGNGYLVVPGTGFLTAGVANVLSAIGAPVEGASPVGMGWNLSSSSVIFPLSDGVRVNLGPVVAIPVSAINSMFPETLSPQLKADMTVATNAILGPTANESILTQMIPNTIVQRLVTAAEPTWNSRSFNSTMMQVLVTMDYNHQLPDPTLAVTDPMAMQSFLDRVRNQTRIMYVMKALVGAFTPVSPELTNPEYNIFNAAVAYDIKQTGSVSKGIQEFLANNPDASPFTVFQSYSPTGSVPASVQAEQWIIDNRSMLRKYPAAGLMMMPMNIDSTYNANVYNEQIAQGLRQKYTPGDTSNNDLSGYIAQLYANAGNAIVLGKWMPQYEAQIKNLSGSAKYAAETAFWGNGQPGNTPANGTLGNYAMKNPVWWDQWQKDMSGQKRGAALTEMRSLLNSPDAPKTQIADNTRNLIKGYDNYMTQLQNASGFTSEQTQITDAWKQFLYSVVANDPTMTNVVTGLFVSIPVPSSVASNVPYSATPGQFTAQSWNQAG